MTAKVVEWTGDLIRVPGAAVAWLAIECGSEAMLRAAMLLMLPAWQMYLLADHLRQA